MQFLIFTIIISATTFTGDVNGLDEGSVCTFNTSESLKYEGSCKRLSECPKALEDMKNKKPTKNCGSFVDNEPLVCCQTVKEVTTKAVGSKSLQKCVEYGRTVFKLIKAPELLENSDVKEINVSTCGEIPTNYLPEWGGRVWIKKFPHMGIIGFESPTKEIDWRCTGSLISENFVLTSAHCMNHPMNYTVKYVSLGVVDFTNQDEIVHSQNITVAEKIVHPDYNAGSYYNDIALLRLSKNVEINEYVRPACLRAKLNLEDQKKAMAVGWGPIDKISTEAKLQQKELDFISQEKCNEILKNEKIFPRGIDYKFQVCTSDSNHDDYKCQGDFGGPLQIYSLEVYCMYDIVGVVSYGKGCKINSPNVFTKVPYYLDWIESILWP